MGTEGLFLSIDQLAENIVSSFNADDRATLKETGKFMLHKMKHHEGMFSVVKRPYIVAKSLFHADRRLLIYRRTDVCCQVSLLLSA